MIAVITNKTPSCLPALNTLDKKMMLVRHGKMWSPRGTVKAVRTDHCVWNMPSEHHANTCSSVLGSATFIIYSLSLASDSYFFFKLLFFSPLLMWLIISIVLVIHSISTGVSLKVTCPASSCHSLYLVISWVLPHFEATLFFVACRGMLVCNFYCLYALIFLTFIYCGSVNAYLLFSFLLNMVSLISEWGVCGTVQVYCPPDANWPA